MSNKRKIAPRVKRPLCAGLGRFIADGSMEYERERGGTLRSTAIPIDLRETDGQGRAIDHRDHYGYGAPSIGSASLVVGIPAYAYCRGKLRWYAKRNNLRLGKIPFSQDEQTEYYSVRGEQTALDRLRVQTWVNVLCQSVRPLSRGQHGIAPELLAAAQAERKAKFAQTEMVDLTKRGKREGTNFASAKRVNPRTKTARSETARIAAFHGRKLYDEGLPK